MCGSESWTMNCLVIQRMEAFEMWVWRRMKKVSRKEKKINEEVLTMKGEKRLLMGKIIKTKKRWVGHLERGNGLLKEIIEERIGGRRPRGRKRLGMLGELKEDGYAKIKRRTENRGLQKEWMPKWTRKRQSTRLDSIPKKFVASKYFGGGVGGNFLLLPITALSEIFLKCNRMNCIQKRAPSIICFMGVTVTFSLI